MSAPRDSGAIGGVADTLPLPVVTLFDRLTGGEVRAPTLPLPRRPLLRGVGEVRMETKPPVLVPVLVLVLLPVRWWRRVRRGLALCCRSRPEVCGWVPSLEVVWAV